MIVVLNGKSDDRRDPRTIEKLSLDGKFYHLGICETRLSAKKVAPLTTRHLNSIARYVDS